mgnify:CR=1 FL=1|jgi:hypothetical protein
MAQGRPAKYKPEFDRIAMSLAMLGATNEEVSAALDVGSSTLNRWKKEHPSFWEALKKGKEPADGEVALSLFQRARGYSHEAVKIFADVRTGEKLIVPYTEHHPPDTTACIFWLKNRRPDLWRDRREQQIEVTKPEDTAKSIFETLQEMEGATDGSAV